MEPVNSKVFRLEASDGDIIDHFLHLLKVIL